MLINSSFADVGSTLKVWVTPPNPLVRAFSGAGGVKGGGVGCDEGPLGETVFVADWSNDCAVTTSTSGGLGNVEDT